MNIINNIKFKYILIVLGFLLKFSLIFMFRGQSDPYNGESINEIIASGQAIFNMPYLPTMYAYMNFRHYCLLSLYQIDRALNKKEIALLLIGLDLSFVIESHE